MNYSYDQPLVLQSGPEELKVAKITPGTATIELADGRVILITVFGVDGVWQNPANADAVDIRPSITIEMIARPEFPVSDAPSAIQ